MTVAALPAVAEYVEDGVSTSFPVPFRFKAPSDLVVTRVAAGTEARLSLGVDYAVTGGTTDAGGTLTRTAATTGATLRIRRATARAQPMVYTTGDRFPAVSHEQALDRQMLIAQEQDATIADLADRAILFGPGETAGAIGSPTTRANKWLGFGALGQMLTASSAALAAAIAPFLPPFLKGDPGGNVLSVGLFSALATIIVPTGTDLIQTSGASGGLLIADPSLTDVDQAAHPLAIVKTSNSRFFRRDTIGGVTPLQFGAKADNISDDLPAFQAALRYLRRQALAGGFYTGGSRLHVPTGRYFLSNTLEIKGVTVIMEGDGTGQAGGNASILRWPVNTCGIIIHRYNTVGSGVEATPTQGADGTIIRNLAFEGANTGGGGSVFLSGIWSRCRSTIRDVVVSGFAGAGILFRATQGSGTPSFEGNANNWRVDTVRLTNNRAGGLVLQGADANAGISHGVDASANGGFGIDDQSFLGNRHSGFQMEANGAGPWRVTDVNAFCWMDGYTEPGQSNSIAGPNTIWSGPQFVPVTPNGGAGLRAAGLAGGGLMSTTGFVAQSNAGTAGLGRAGALIDLQTPTSDVYRFADVGGASMALTYANLLTLLRFYSDGSTLVKKPRLSMEAGSTLGAVVRKVAVTSEDGSVAGFIPIYSSIG